MDAAQNASSRKRLKQNARFIVRVSEGMR